MSEEITASINFNKLTMLSGLRWHNRANRRSTLLRTMFLLAGWLMVFSGLFLSFGDRKMELSAATVGYVITPTIVATALSLALRQYVLKRQFVAGLKSSPLFDQLIAYQASESGIDVVSPVSTGKLSWIAFHKTVGTPEGVLLYHQKRLFNWLPKAAFTSEDEYNRFLDLLAAKTKHTKLG
jgi:hypothetical protein